MATNKDKIYEELNLSKEDLQSLVRCFLPDIQAYFKSEEGIKAYEDWEKKIHKRIFSEGLVLAVTSYCISKFINSFFTFFF